MRPHSLPNHHLGLHMQEEMEIFYFLRLKLTIVPRQETDVGFV